SIASGAITADSSAIANVVGGIVPAVTDKIAFTKSAVAGLGDNTGLIKTLVADMINTGVPAGLTSNGFTIIVASAFPKNVSPAVAVVLGGASTLSDDASRKELANSAINTISSATAAIANAVGALVTDKPSFAHALA